VFLFKERKVAERGVQWTVQSRLYPLRPTPNPQVIAGSHNFPPHLSGLPPDPVPPLRLQCWEYPALLELGEAGGPPRSFAQGRNRGASAPQARPLRSSTFGSAVLGWAHGVGRQSRSPSHSRAQERAPCFGLPTNAGGGRHRCSTDRTGRVAYAPRYSHGRVLTGLSEPKN
jgi:hypothetical protein